MGQQPRTGSGEEATAQSHRRGPFRWRDSETDAVDMSAGAVRRCWGVSPNVEKRGRKARTVRETEEAHRRRPQGLPGRGRGGGEAVTPAAVRSRIGPRATRALSV